MKFLIFLWDITSRMLVPAVAVILFLLTIVTIRRGIILFKLKKLCLSVGMRGIKLRLLPNVFKKKGRYDIEELVQKRSLFMPWENVNDGNLNVIVFNNFPNHLSDINTRDSLLGNGDKTVGGIVVYDINGFEEYLCLRK